jgi:hypothetical protein
MRKSCPDCFSVLCVDRRKVECLGCGAERCFAEGLGNGRCKACHYGILPNWSGWDRPCGYKDCDGRASFAGVPGKIKRVCHGCSIRPKVVIYPTPVYPATGSRTIRVTLQEYIDRQKIKTNPIVG